jgi:hypothetical protein
MLPSGEEAAVLRKAITKAKIDVQVFPWKGHALLDGSAEVKSVIFSSSAFPELKLLQQSAPSEIEIPSPSLDQIREARQMIAPLRAATSPVFFSTNDVGQISRGLENVPLGTTKNPVLLVGNHQLYGGPVTSVAESVR